MVEAVPAGPRIALRTCVGCRTRAARSHLLRVVALDRGTGLVLVLDERRRLPGRGAWLHARVECLDQAVRRKAFARALRVGATLDPADLAARISALAEREQQDTGAVTDGGAGRIRNRKRV
ncbi:MAG: YlxR family protein [Actinobacteria bacterium]|nr:YlxR family protein [Actinomycetota bacterium]